MLIGPKWASLIINPNLKFILMYMLFISEKLQKCVSQFMAMGPDVGIIIESYL